MSDVGIEALIASVRGDPGAMVGLARSLLLPSGRKSEARALCAEALTLAPDDAELQARVEDVCSLSVGGWYFSNLQDVDRNALYARAFERTIFPGAIVFEVGAGTGFFAMMAARAGAGHVYACERDRRVAALAREVVARNGYAERITILDKDSRDIEIGVDLPARADVLLWDNLANNLLSGGAADAVEDVRRRLLKPEAAIVPRRAEIQVGLVRDAQVGDIIAGTIDGFDLSAFNAVRPTNFTLDRSTANGMSTSATLFDIDFAGAMPLRPDRKTVVVTASGGPVQAIAQWLRFELADGVFYETGLGTTARAFGVLWFSVAPFEAVAGEQVTIGGAHDRQRSWFWVER